MKFRSFLIVPLVVVLLLCLANAVMGSMDLPTYGVWTGTRPIEDKLKRLEVFAKAGPVDAIVVGSSIADFGFSAELYTKLMTEKLGRPYRVFNFSTGGAELVTTPGLIRIALTVVTPAAIIVVAPPEIKRSNVIHPASVDHILNNAPIGAFLADERLLHWEKLAWSLPILEKAAAARDLFLFGSYKNLIGTGMDTYAVNDYGDRLSYSAGQVTEEWMSELAHLDLVNVRPLNGQAEHDIVAAREAYFPELDIDAMADIKKLAAIHHMKIIVLAHTAAIHVWRTPTRDPGYVKGRTQYLETLAKSVDGKLINPLNDLSVPDFAVMDGTHVNTYGAEIFTRATAEEAVAPGSPHPVVENIEQVPLNVLRPPGPTFSLWSAIILHKPGDPTQVLKCQFVHNFAVPAFPETDLFMALRLPDGTDIVAPAKKLEAGVYQAEVNLRKTAKTQSMILRLLYGTDKKEPVSAPLSQCRWLAAP